MREYPVPGSGGGDTTYSSLPMDTSGRVFPPGGNTSSGLPTSNTFLRAAMESILARDGSEAIHCK
eukprot:scaffold18037_cov60-Attheya_sp.AAC.2